MSVFSQEQSVLPDKSAETVDRNLLSRQAFRSERTRSALLGAAEKVFARDGFEASRIEDIATEAGRSRGAFYSNFDSKTEVFLALRALATLRRAREVKQRIMRFQTEEARKAAVLDYMLEQLCDPDSLLLQIEFKLFALRHPEMLAELAEKHLEASSSINLEILPEFFPKDGRALIDIHRETLVIEAILEGFALNALFSPGLLDRECLTRIVPELFARVLPDKLEISTPD